MATSNSDFDGINGIGIFDWNRRRCDVYVADGPVAVVGNVSSGGGSFMHGCCAMSLAKWNVSIDIAVGTVRYCLCTWKLWRSDADMVLIVGRFGRTQF